jgi:glycosyltransferase involved in cell wall biosynthesis
VPSLWFEGFGLVVMEAMLRGIPVLSSDAGGLVEAKMGTDFVIPVRCIERYEAVFDDQGLPKPVLPEQDIALWTTALRAVISDRELYRTLSDVSREAALRFVASLWPQQLEEFLAALRPAEPVAASGHAAEKLSAERRALLLERLRARGSKSNP